MNYTNKRRHKRVFFSKGDEVSAEIARLNLEEEQSFPATILDLSESGVGVTLSRTHVNAGLKKGDRLVLEKVDGLPILDDGDYVEMEVRWVLDISFLDSIGFGCEFEVIPDSVRSQIQLIVEVAG